MMSATCSGMGSAPHPFAARRTRKKPFARQVPQHPGYGRVGQPEETTRLGQRHAQARHLVELRANPVDRRLPEQVRQTVRTARVPRVVEHYGRAFPTWMRSTTCVTPSLPRTVDSTRCFSAALVTVPCSSTTPSFAVISSAD